MFGDIHVQYVADHSLHAAITKKRKISDSKAIIWCTDCSYMLYNLGVMNEGKGKRKKE